MGENMVVGRTRRSIVCSLGLALLAAGMGCGVSAPSTPSTSGGATEKGPTVKGPTEGGGAAVSLLNVSYDPTRELWKELNTAFAAAHKAETGTEVTIQQSHGASGSQARAIIDGLDGDVATLSLWPDTAALQGKGLIPAGWEERLPNRSLAYTSTVVFVVRKGNPKGIKDWADLVKEGVEVITPNPKTSGNGRLSFLGAWGSVLEAGGDEAAAKEFVAKLYKNVPVLDTGARGSTSTFAQKGIGDVNLTMESEARLEVEEAGGELEVVYPSLSILHEPHLTIVDKVVDKKGTRAVAEAYLKFLWTPAGQEIIAKHHYRPIDADVLAKHAADFPPMKLLPITRLAKDWTDAQAKFFADGGVFDSLSNPDAAAK
jgi:sulfate transport system substrate-binding protein